MDELRMRKRLSLRSIIQPIGKSRSYGLSPFQMTLREASPTHVVIRKSSDLRIDIRQNPLLRLYDQELKVDKAGARGRCNDSFDRRVRRPFVGHDDESG